MSNKETKKNCEDKVKKKCFGCGGLFDDTEGDLCKDCFFEEYLGDYNPPKHLDGWKNIFLC